MYEDLKEAVKYDDVDLIEEKRAVKAKAEDGGRVIRVVNQNSYNEMIDMGIGFHLYI